MSEDGIFPAETAEEKEAIYRFRYEIYVEEMQRYRAIADHDKRLLIEPDDAQSRHFYALRDGQFAGCMRFTWGDDAPFTDRHIEQYDLAPFLERLPQKTLIVGERFMIHPDFRGTDLLFRMFCTYLNFVNERRIQLIFGDCEPHLLNVYLGLGFRTYTRQHVNSPETGYLIPLVMVPEDFAYFRSVGSPLVSVLKDFGADAHVPANIEDLLKGGEAVISQRLYSMDVYWRNVQQALGLLEKGRVQLFDDIDEAQVQRCLEKSSIIDCRKGDHIIKKGNVAQNMFVVLKGNLEVRDGDDIIAVLSPGDVFGEMAFFLNLPRTKDIFAVTESVQVLSLSDSAMRQLVSSDSEVAAKLLLNISKMLCLKLLQQN